MADNVKQPAFDSPREQRAPDDVFAPKHAKTYGEKKFNFLTYNAIGYIANALLSVVAIWWVERTHSGDKMMKGFVNQVSKIPKVNADQAQFYATKTFFLAGGFMVMPVIKALEDRKLDLVKKWNRKHYGEQAQTDPDIVKSENEIATSHKQSWGSVLSSRIIALVPFYLGYWLVWDNKSPLSRFSNPKLSEMPAAKIAYEAKFNASEFSKKASTGIYIDRPIAAFSRLFGKGAAKLTRNTEAVEKIAEMSEKYPGMVKHGLKDIAEPGVKTPSPDRDPAHVALPYYVVSEAITSGIVAWGVFALTRVLGPILGKKPDAPMVQKTEVANTAPVASAAPQEAEQKKDTPSLKVSAIEHHATAAHAQHAAARH